ncbi:MAG: hypothetical protein IKI29_03940 [Clostridia bacterium]|nr:hypothetical protein [Clostridia bacterium]
MKQFTVFLTVILLIFSLGMPAFAEGTDDLIVNNCDSSANWAANSQGMDALETDGSNCTEGTGSIGATAINGKLNQLVYTPESPLDASKYSYLEFDIYFSDITWFTECGSVMFELTSSGTCDKESNRYMKKVLKNLFSTGSIEDRQNWWHFVFELDNPQGTANGKLDKANFNYFRFYTVDPITTTPDYTVRIDNMRFTNNPSNYKPAVEEEEKDASKTENTKESEEASVYVVKREDTNAALSGQLKTLLIVEIAVSAVVVAVIVVMIILFVRKNKRS